MNRTLIVITILAFGISAFFRKLAVDKMHPYNMQVVSAFIYASLIPLWYNIAPKEEAGYNSAGILLTIITILVHIGGSVAFGFLLKSTNSTGALTVMISCSPIITTFLSIAFLKEQFEMRQFFAAILTLTGLALFTMK